jgi:hypothetical protein
VRIDAAQAGEALIAQLAAVTDRRDEIIPAYGFVQAEREVASVPRPVAA